MGLTNPIAAKLAYARFAAMPNWNYARKIVQEEYMKKITTVLVALALSTVLFGCKSKEEKLVSEYLKAYEQGIVKIEKLKKDVTRGKTSQQEAFGQWMTIGYEIDGLAKSDKYKDLPKESEWSEADKAKKKQLDERLAKANK